MRTTIVEDYAGIAAELKSADAGSAPGSSFQFHGNAGQVLLVIDAEKRTITVPDGVTVDEAAEGVFAIVNRLLQSGA